MLTIILMSNQTAFVTEINDDSIRELEYFINPHVEIQPRMDTPPQQEPGEKGDTWSATEENKLPRQVVIQFYNLKHYLLRHFN